MIFKGSYLASQGNKDTFLNAFSKNFHYKNIQEEPAKFDAKILRNLWKRKYLFIGNFTGLLLQNNDWNFLYEPFPSSLYHSDDAIVNFSKNHEPPLYLFFYYPESKSAGIKIFEHGACKRNLESEIDFKVYKNSGAKLKFENDIEGLNKNLNQNILSDYLKQLNIPMIQDLFSTQNHPKYITLQR